MRALGHSHFIMNFYEIHETVNSIYMVLEHLEGGELLNRLKKSK